jgi:hypothetical protein
MIGLRIAAADVMWEGRWWWGGVGWAVGWVFGGQKRAI